MEFHISRKARDELIIDTPILQSPGSSSALNNLASRELARKINSRVDLSQFPEHAVLASNVSAMILLNEINHHIFEIYRQQINPNVVEQLLIHLEANNSPETVDAMLIAFCEIFPPISVYDKTIKSRDYLANSTGRQPNRQLLMEEVLILWLSNNNPALQQFNDLLDDSDLAKNKYYLKIVQFSEAFFKHQPAFGPENVDLLNMLHKPVEASPNSLQGQLEYIRNNWGFLLGNLLSRILSSLDFIKEESKAVFAGAGPTIVPDYKTIRQMIDLEKERFSPDKDWMPSLVLMAKNAYVWLDQLSKKYQRAITHLNEIPDEELDFLAHAGYTGLWLIGLWQRSKASEQIKRLCGNPEAVASAYSIESYRIADDLGGEDALSNLRDRAWQRGIRMASDMVPNHMGIDSDWVLHRPDYFLSLDYCPFPSYSFNGPNLSPEPNIGIHLEDHYFSRSDASVVFRRTDYQTGSVKYIYHGNDGTVMPWNDTAQLNYLLPEVREAVIQIILDVARRTPIIRFDAAMTLAKKHIERLWFPEPGSGGAIPTRSDHSLSKAEFDRLLPEEFWREVVDRVAKEVPDTLLLAEAFWLMEGFFVRTLGMHRVYNSAFMNMLRDEENAKFRTLIKNTLEFDPDILKRYVNFMNNPDEKTAVEQFGNGDKYFGVCTIMSTLPGLPMFGHGQLEGFSEKYGMEYRKAYLDETVDEGLLNHHWKAIFPLLRTRERYSGSNNFRLFDFHRENGSVDEDVFAYSNNFNNQRSLVFFNNKYSHTHGSIHTAAPVLNKNVNGDKLISTSLAWSLGMANQPNHFLVFRDMVRGLTYIRDSDQINRQGFPIELKEYEYRVFGDFYEVQEESNTHYRELCEMLDGRGVPDIHLEMRKLHLRPIHAALKKLMETLVIAGFSNLLVNFKIDNTEEFIKKNEAGFSDLYEAFCNVENCENSIGKYHTKLVADINGLGGLFRKYQNGFGSNNTVSSMISNQSFAGYWDEENLPALWLWVIIRALVLSDHEDCNEQLIAYYNEWLLEDFINLLPSRQIQNPGLDWVSRMLFFQNTSIETPEFSAREFLQTNLQNPEISHLLGINRSNDIIWFDRDKLEEWTHLQLFLATISIQENVTWNENRKLEMAIKAYQLIQEITVNIPESDYKVEKLLGSL